MLTVPIKDLVSNWVEIDDEVWLHETTLDIINGKVQVASDRDMSKFEFGLLMHAVQEWW